jgi:hypothetical protein
MLGAIRSAKEQADQTLGYTDFARAAAVVMTTNSIREAAAKAAAFNLRQSIVEGLTKAALPGGTVGGVGISAFGPAVSNAFLSSSRNLGFADEVARFSMLFSDMVGRAYIYSAFSAGTVSEGAAKPLKAITMSASDFTPVKTSNLVVLTKELVDALGDVGVRTLGDELRKGVAIATDSAFLTFLVGNSHDSSVFAGTWADFLLVFDEMLRNVDTGTASRLFLIVTSETMKGIATAALGAGIDSIGYGGGSLAGVELRVSEAQSANRLTMLDSTGLAVAMGELELRSTTHASIQMDDVAASHTSGPSVAAVSLVSLWQTNSVGLRCERAIAVKSVRPNAFFHMTGVIVGDEGGSPSLP